MQKIKTTFSKFTAVVVRQLLYWSGLPFPSPRDLPDPGIKPRYPTLQVNSLPAEPPEKPKNSSVGTLSLLQGIFPTQGSNPGLPQCRWFLYQLSHKISPRIPDWVAYSFSSGSSQPWNQTRVSGMARLILDQLSYQGSQGKL